MKHEDIVPSSGFTASVMDAITREATAPPPIPFPWKRALPGLGWCLVVGIAFLTMSPGSISNAPSAPDLSAALNGAGWITAALMMSLLSVALTRRIGR